MIVCEMCLVHLNSLHLQFRCMVCYGMGNATSQQYDESAQVSQIESYRNCMGEQLEICWNYPIKSQTCNTTHM